MADASPEIPDRLQDKKTKVMREEAPKVWEAYREYSPADLEAAIRWLQPRAKKASQQFESALLNGDLDDAEELIIVFAQLNIRLATAQKHIEKQLIHLGEPLSWAETETVPNWIQEELTDRQVDDIVRNQKIRAEWRARQEGEEKKKTIRKDLAEKYGRSESQIKKIVYGD